MRDRFAAAPVAGAVRGADARRHGAGARAARDATPPPGVSRVRDRRRPLLRSPVPVRRADRRLRRQRAPLRVLLPRGAGARSTACGIAPDVLHCHDWQTALVPVYLRAGMVEGDPAARRGRAPPRAAIVLTVHNLGYQGLFPPSDFAGDRAAAHLFAIDGRRVPRPRQPAQGRHPATPTTSPR